MLFPPLRSGAPAGRAVRLRSAGRGPNRFRPEGLAAELGPEGSERATARPQRPQGARIRTRGGGCTNKNLNARPWYPRSRPGPRDLLRALGRIPRSQGQALRTPLLAPFASGSRQQLVQLRAVADCAGHFL